MSTRTLFALIAAAWLSPLAASAATPNVAWRDCLRQPADWYRGEEAARIADNLLLYQRDVGGWPKNVDMATPLSESDRARLAAEKARRQDATIDNGATVTQLRFLARVREASGEVRYGDAFLRGLDFLLEAQYPNGGWPQFPFGSGYGRHITFNDNAMINVMTLLREAAAGAAPFAFVDESRRDRAARAVARGIDCILRCQVIVDGRRTIWCAQHDAVTLEPAQARSYELPSLCGSESVGIVRFLMQIEAPAPELRDAVQSALAWFEAARLTGIRETRRPDPSLPGGYDKVVVADPDADPLWARFYEIGTNRPFFCGRDGVKKYALAEIEHERRVGYGWYTGAPADLLARDALEWRAKWGEEPWVAGWRRANPVWRGIQLSVSDDRRAQALIEQLPRLAALGVNALVIEVDYNFEFVSLPALRAQAALTAGGAARLARACRGHGIRPIPLFNCLGHQSWDKTTLPLLARHPEFDETPGQYPENKGIYCRSWCPQHPDVNRVVFALIDELIDAFDADAVHVGMDEVFLIASEHCPRCRGGDPARLFARAVNDLHTHLVGARKVEMLMWADRLLDDNVMGYGEWEAARNGTHPAVDMIPKDIVLCDWHYGKRADYPSIPFFLGKGFRVWPAGWKDAEATEALATVAKSHSQPRMLGHLCTTWGAVTVDGLADWPPIVGAMRLWR